MQECKTTFQIGERVRWLYGEGTVVDPDYTEWHFVKILWDETPPLEYNMGENPTVHIATQIAPIEPQP